LGWVQKRRPSFIVKKGWCRGVRGRRGDEGGVTLVTSQANPRSRASRCHLASRLNKKGGKTGEKQDRPGKRGGGGGTEAWVVLKAAEIPFKTNLNTDIEKQQRRKERCSATGMEGKKDHTKTNVEKNRRMRKSGRCLGLNRKKKERWEERGGGAGAGEGGKENLKLCAASIIMKKNTSPSEKMRKGKGSRDKLSRLKPRREEKPIGAGDFRRTLQ